MKKILYILFALTLFMSCSKDDDDNTAYIDPSILNGKWSYSATDGSGTTLEYTYSFNNGHVLHYWSTNWNSGTWLDSKFKLTETDIIPDTYLEVGATIKYKIIADTLFIGEKSKYIKRK